MNIYLFHDDAILRDLKACRYNKHLFLERHRKQSESISYVDITPYLQISDYFALSETERADIMRELFREIEQYQVAHAKRWEPVWDELMQKAIKRTISICKSHGLSVRCKSKPNQVYTASLPGVKVSIAPIPLNPQAFWYNVLQLNFQSKYEFGGHILFNPYYTHINLNIRALETQYAERRAEFDQQIKEEHENQLKMIAIAKEVEAALDTLVQSYGIS